MKNRLKEGGKNESRETYYKALEKVYKSNDGHRGKRGETRPDIFKVDVTEIADGLDDVIKDNSKIWNLNN